MFWMDFVWKGGNKRGDNLNYRPFEYFSSVSGVVRKMI